MAEKAAVRAELEETRTAFHALAAQVSDADWKRKSSIPEWTVGQMLFHVTSYLTMIIPWGVDGVRKGKKISGMQPWIAHSFAGNWANSLGMRWFARKERPATILHTYDAAHVNVQASIAAIPAQVLDGISGQTITYNLPLYAAAAIILTQP
ncbi:MAG: DinB family protein [Dehalococcoidia bacterium]|nr:DinB family protein [Dehalococcoidia bacterium]